MLHQEKLKQKTNKKNHHHKDYKEKASTRTAVKYNMLPTKAKIFTLQPEPLSELSDFEFSTAWSGRLH